MVMTITGNADTYAESLTFDEFIEELEEIARTPHEKGIIGYAIRMLKRYRKEMSNGNT